MTKIPKRLTPKIEVLRELYLKSGNQCAFPGCNHLIIDTNGVFIGQLCHIESALPGGPRFNPNQTNEDRRSFENLLLMCTAHHKITDNEDEFPVDRMKEIKANHESQFTNAEEKILASIVDRTTLNNPTIPTSLNKMNEVLAWDLNQEQLKECVTEICSFIERLQKLPIETRQLLVIMAQRNHGRDISGVSVHISEIETVTHCGPEYLVGQFEMLESYGFIPGIDKSDYGTHVTVLRDLSSGWPIWEDLIKFSNSTGNSLYEIIVYLNFDILD